MQFCYIPWIYCTPEINALLLHPPEVTAVLLIPHKLLQSCCFPLKLLQFCYIPWSFCSSVTFSEIIVVLLNPSEITAVMLHPSEVAALLLHPWIMIQTARYNSIPSNLSLKFTTKKTVPVPNPVIDSVYLHALNKEHRKFLHSAISGFGRSRWQHSLKSGTVAARLLGLRVRIRPTLWLSACCEHRKLSGKRVCVRPVTRPEETYRVWCAWLW